MSDKQLFWFVQEGRMMNGWRVAELVFDYNEYDYDGETVKDPSNRDYRDFHYMLDIGQQVIQTSESLPKMLDRPGKWYFMSGMRLVHGDDLYDTREEAAKAEYNRLIKEKE